jgi:FtsH-binding integral membrane protein
VGTKRAYFDEYDEDIRRDGFAADATVDERIGFIRRVYLHVFGSIVAFMVLAGLFLTITPLRDALIGLFFMTHGLMMLAYIGVCFLCRYWAHCGASQQTQYVGLGLYVVAEAVIFTPLLAVCSDPALGWGGNASVIPTAAFLTMLIFGGLTAVVLLTKQDFSFLGGLLWMLSLAALGVIIAAMFVPLGLGVWFVVAMIVLFSGWILYDTSQILYHFDTDQHVAAALELFASIANLFWYVLQFVLIAASEE